MCFPEERERRERERRERERERERKGISTHLVFPSKKTIIIRIWPRSQPTSSPSRGGPTRPSRASSGPSSPRGRGAGARGGGGVGQDDEGRRLVGWWGLSHPAQISHAAQIGVGHQTVRRGPSGGSARLLQSQILPASGVAREVKGKQQQQQRERQR